MVSYRTHPKRWVIAALQVLLLLFTFVVPVGAATPTNVPLQGPDLLQLLTHYGIVRGDNTGNLNLDKPITRAEMATILVRTLGLEPEALGMSELVLFTDTQGHWGSGYINMARIKGLLKGDPSGAFRPDDNVTYAEAFTMVLRLVDNDPDAATWPASALLLAAELNLLPAGFNGYADLDKPAVRGQVFHSLATSVVTQQTPEGGTYLQKYVDSTPPTVTLGSVPATTNNSAVTVTGTASDAVRVTVNGNAAVLGANGTFTAQVSLVYGSNTITVEAFDRAGNKGVASTVIARSSPIARIEVSGPNKVAMSEKTTFTVSAFDSSNQPTTTTGITASVEGGIGTFDVNTGVFSAGSQAGTGQIVFTAGTVSKSVSVQVLGSSVEAVRLSIRPVNAGAPVPTTREMTVEVSVLDEDGLLVEDDFGREVSLAVSGPSGVRVSPSMAKTQGGIATFKVTSSSEGLVTLVAAASGLASSSQTAEFGTSTYVVLSTEHSSVIIGGTPFTTRIRAELRNDQGQAIANNTDSDITISLTSTGPGMLTDSTLTIRRGQSNSITSGDDGRFEAVGDSGTGVVRGSITSSHRYSVAPVSVGVTIPTVGSGTKFEVLTPPNTLTPGDTGVFIIRVADAQGSTITTGSYAFQLKVDTSNDDPKTDGIPDGVTVLLGDTAYNPVSDGIAEGASKDTDDVIARTINGQAVVRVTYTKGGSVTITPVPVQATSKAYSDTGEEGAALGSTSFSVQGGPAFFSATPRALTIEVDSELGTAQPAGATPNNPARTFVVRVKVVDGDGNWVPNATNPITLTDDTKNGSTSYSDTNPRNATNGAAEFKVQATSKAGMDTWTASAPGLVSASVNLYTRNVKPDQPSILAIRGVKDGEPRQNDLISADDTHMEVDLAQDTAAGWVSVKVYAHNSNTLLYRTDAVNMAEVSPQVRIPRSKLVNGNSRYQVVINNGFADSVRSEASNVVTNAKALTSISISSARYDAVEHKMTVTASGMTTSDGFIDTSRLSVVKGNNVLSLLGTTAVIKSSSQFEINLSVLPDVYTALENSPTFSGADVRLDAEAGWYQRANGDSAAADTTGNLITPLPYIAAVTYDSVSKQIIIEGSGLATGSFNLSKLTIFDPSTNTTFPFNSTNANTSVSRADNRITITLRDAGNALLQDTAKFDGGDSLEADAGWIYSDSINRAAPVSISLYTRVTVRSVAYDAKQKTLTISGSGFGGSAASLTEAKLRIVDSNHPNSALNLGGAIGSVDSDARITIVLDDDQHAALMNANVFAGSNIYLIGDEGWLQDANERSARPIPGNTVRLPQPQP